MLELREHFDREPWKNHDSLVFKSIKKSARIEKKVIDER